MEDNGHDWITNGLEQSIPHKIPESKDRSDRVDYVEEDLAAVSRDTGILINSAVTRSSMFM